MGQYKFTRSITGRIIIEGKLGKPEEWTVETLRFVADSTALPGELRSMARDALREFGLLQETQEPEVIPSDTITTIEGIKVYQDLFSRAFFFVLRETRLFGSLSDIERKIKELKR